MSKSDTILAVVLAIVAFIFISSKAGTSTYLVVLSESMKPTINMGDLVVTTLTDTNNIRTGDIIAFKNGNGEIPITHRVVNVTASGFITKGDANDDVDIQARRQSDVLGRIVFWIPLAGYFVSFARSFYGFIILIIIPGILLIALEARKIIRYAKEGKNKTTTIKNLAMLLIPIVLMSASLSAMPTETYFSDTEISSGNFFSVKCPSTTLTKWWSDTQNLDVPINSFDIVFHNNTKKITSTNPGGFFININIINVPSTNSISILDLITNNIRPTGDFNGQSKNPIHAYINGNRDTGTEVTNKFYLSFNGTLLNATLKQGENLEAENLYVTLHLDYSLKSLNNTEIRMFPRNYSNKATVIIGDKIIENSLVNLTANLKYV